jgi:hypothetical protein
MLPVALQPTTERLNVRLADVILAAAVVAWIVALIRGPAGWREGRIYRLLGIYAAALVLAALFSSDVRRSAVRLLVELALLTLCVLTFNVVSSQRMLRRVLQAWMAGTAFTVVAALAGVVLFYAGVRDPAVNFTLSGYGSLPPGNYPRVHGLMIDMNLCCQYLSVSFLLALVMRRVGWLTKKWFWLFTAGIWAACAFTVSPGLGGLLLGTGLWIWAARRDRLGKWALTAGAAAAAAFVFAMMISPHCCPGKNA